REVHFDCIDQRHQPLQKRLMYRMAVVGLDSSRIREFHYAANDKTSSARRNILADIGFQYQRNMMFQLANFAQHANLLCFRYTGLQSKSKHVNEHWFAVSFGGIDCKDSW